MYLSTLTNRDLSGELAPWADGVDTDHFVVVDSNVDLFLTKIQYCGAKTYRARRAFIQSLAARIHLDELRPGVRRYNPRLVQQALYMFMSETNRRANPVDCCHDGPTACSRCPGELSSRCSFNAASDRATEAAAEVAL